MHGNCFQIFGGNSRKIFFAQVVANCSLFSLLARPAVKSNSIFPPPRRGNSTCGRIWRIFFFAEFTQLRLWCGFGEGSGLNAQKIFNSFRRIFQSHFFVKSCTARLPTFCFIVAGLKHLEVRENEKRSFRLSMHDAAHTYRYVISLLLLLLLPKIVICTSHCSLKRHLRRRKLPGGGGTRTDKVLESMALMNNNI